MWQDNVKHLFGVEQLRRWIHDAFWLVLYGAVDSAGRNIALSGQSILDLVLIMMSVGQSFELFNDPYVLSQVRGIQHTRTEHWYSMSFVVIAYITFIVLT